MQTLSAPAHRALDRGAPAPLRLALFSDTWPPQVNGVARTLERLRDAVSDRGGVSRVFTVADPAATDADPGVVRSPSVPFWVYPQLRIALPLYRRVVPELAAFRPSLVHVATPFGVGLAGRSAAGTLGVPLVTSYHTSFAAYARHYGLGALESPGWTYLRWFHNRGIRTYCPTTAVARELDGHGFHGTRVWSRGVDADRFSPRHRSAGMRARLGVGPHSVVIAYVGRLAVEKGLDTALDAIAQLARTHPDLDLVFAFAGDGPYEAVCHRRAPQNARFLGRVVGDELSRLYASADLFMFPSATDTFGNVLLEAMASGLPVVAAESAPTRELLGPDRGAIFPAGDSAALAACIASLASRPLERAALAARGIAFARQCRWTDVFDHLFDDYADAMLEQ